MDEAHGRAGAHDELIDKIAAQSDAQAGGLSVRELERLRDDNLVAILQALRAREMPRARCCTNTRRASSLRGGTAS